MKLSLDTKTQYIKNDTYKTIYIVLIFPTEYHREDMHNLKILKMFLRSYSANYPTEEKFKRELAKHFIIGFSISSKVMGDNLFIRFDLTIPMDHLIDDYDIEDSFKFFIDTIYNPLAKDGIFDQDKFDREYDFIKTRMVDSERSIYGYGFHRLLEIFDPNEEYITHHETNMKYLEDTTSASAYDLYQRAVLNNQFISYVYGNFDEDKIRRLFKKYLPEEENVLEIDKCYNRFFKLAKKEYTEETSKFKQTALYMVYTVKDLKDEEREYLTLIGNILGSRENDLIFNTLRLNNNLVYSSNVNKYVYEGAILIETYLQYKNVKKATQLVRETIGSLKNKDILHEAKERLIEGIKLDLLKASDSKYFILENKIDEDLDYRPLKEIYEIYSHIDEDEIIKFLDRLEENTIFVLRGENDEEE